MNSICRHCKYSKKDHIGLELLCPVAISYDGIESKKMYFELGNV